MATKVKIKIVDDQILRKGIDGLYQGIDQIVAAKWAICMAKSMIEL